MAARYWCYMCSQAVNPIIDDDEIKCSHCGSEFVEEMGEEIVFGTRFRRTEFGVDNDEVNIADGNDNHGRHRDSEHDREIELDRELDSITRRRRRSSASAAILQLIQDTDRIFDRLLHSLDDDDSIRGQWTLPARNEAVGNLPTVKVCEPLTCSVCLEDFAKGSEAKEMPCKHKFHIQCIVPWLELHSSCPVCRYVLLPDDARNNSISHGTI